MTLLIGAVVLFVAVAMIAPAITSQILNAQVQEQASGRNNSSNGDFSERDEFRQTYRLGAGARVEVSSINGTVDVETVEGSEAEVHIIRQARNRDDLNYRKVTVEHDPNRLVVRGEPNSKRVFALLFGRNPKVRQRVMLRVPRQINLATTSVNGRVRVGQVDGPVRVSSVNGRVEVQGLRGHAEVSSINGSVGLTVTRLDDEGGRGMRVSSINGAVEMRFGDNLNADLSVSSINGRVSLDVPNVTMQGEYKPTNFRARIGEGGTPISVSSVNGSVKLARAAPAAL